MAAIFLADLTNIDHQSAIVELLDMYSRDGFGAGQPLSAEARANLIPGLIKHGGARVFLAYEGDRPAGVAICLVGFSTFRGKPLVNIHDIAVVPEFRGQGIGRKLLEAVEQDARDLGCGKVTLEVKADNEVAQQVYRRVGFGPSSEPETWFWSKRLD
jgi:ribosomal protein S18 acetylase RimI-like enzyme